MSGSSELQFPWNLCCILKKLPVFIILTYSEKVVEILNYFCHKEIFKIEKIKDT
jgi:hypothetical protein